MNGFVTGSAFNRYTNLDNIEWKIIDYLVKSKSKYANYLWKILKYDTEECLTKADLTEKEKWALVYKNNGESTQYRVFMTPFTDDAWEQQSSHLHIYVYGINPMSHITGKVHVCFECIIHNKISNIYGDASEYNPNTNPVELDDNGNPVIEYKSRATEMLKDIIAALNGEMINAIGVLQFNEDLSPYDTAKAALWNRKNFFGYRIIMTSLISGVSENSECGY